MVIQHTYGDSTITIGGLQMPNCLSDTESHHRFVSRIPYPISLPQQPEIGEGEKERGEKERGERKIEKVRKQEQIHTILCRQFISLHGIQSDHHLPMISEPDLSGSSGECLSTVGP
eukprot:sb/3476682/